jgi:predicted ATP-grasp superfamily ATP-dependent carboligase
MPATDTAVTFMTQHGVELSRLFRIASPPTESIEYAIGKAPFSVHAEKHNIPTPRTRIVENFDDLHRAAAELTGPYVLKPNVKSPRWDELAGFKVLLADDRTALVEGYERCKDWSDCFVIQEWVAGNDEAMYSYYAFIAEDERVVAECVGHKIRQWPRLTGSGTLSEICDEPEIRETGRLLLESLDHRGFATINMKRDANTGKLFVIEINAGRPGMGMFVAEAAGIEMTHLAYQALVGQPLPSTPLVRFPNARWVSMKRDFASALAGWRQGELSLAAYLRSIRGVRRRAVFDLRDPLPFLYDVLRSPGQVYRRRSEECH